MSEFWKCFWYLSATAVIYFLLGRILPKRWFCPDKFPYKSYKFEKNGNIYNKMKIRRWQHRVPDMSRWFPRLMPSKNMSAVNEETILLMLRETCIAEFIHKLHLIGGLLCLYMYPAFGGVLIVCINAFLLNLPFIIIQRYNRPRLMRVYKKLRDSSKTTERGDYIICEC